LSAYAVASRYGTSDSELHSLRVNVNASAEKSVMMSASWIRTLVMISAGTGTFLPLVFARNDGMSRSLAATNSTSADISVHARYAPRTEMITPTLMKAVPQ
jgi:hypothetical protein